MNHNLPFSQRPESKTKIRFLLGTAFVTTILTSQAHAQSAQAQFVPFRDFVQSVSSANLSDALASSRSSTSNLAQPAALGEMRQHLLSLYQGVDVRHSYVLGAQTFDCVP